MRDKIWEIIKPNYFDGKTYNPKWRDDVNSLLSLFQSEMEKVIGEDEVCSTKATHRVDRVCPVCDDFDSRNALREEQRQKLANLINTIEEKVSPLT